MYPLRTQRFMQRGQYNLWLLQTNQYTWHSRWAKQESRIYATKTNMHHNSFGSSSTPNIQLIYLGPHNPWQLQTNFEHVWQERPLGESDIYSPMYRMHHSSIHSNLYHWTYLFGRHSINSDKDSYFYLKQIFKHGLYTHYHLHGCSHLKKNPFK